MVHLRSLNLWVLWRLLGPKWQIWEIVSHHTIIHECGFGRKIAYPPHSTQIDSYINRVIIFITRESTHTLTHWGRVMHICASNLTIISSDNGLSPGRRQAIIWTNAGKLLFGPPGTNFIEILIDINTFSFKKMHLKMSSGKCRPFCIGLNVLTHPGWCTYASVI